MPLEPKYGIGQTVHRFPHRQPEKIAGYKVFYLLEGYESLFNESEIAPWPPPLRRDDAVRIRDGGNAVYWIRCIDQGKVFLVSLDGTHVIVPLSELVRVPDEERMTDRG